MKLSRTGKTNLGFALALALSAAIGVVTAFSLRRAADDLRWLAHTHQVLTELEATRATILDAETSQRGFLLTGQRASFDRFRNASARLDAYVSSVRMLTQDNPAQRRSIAELVGLIGARRSQLDRSLALVSRDGLPAVRAYISTGVAVRTMDRIRAVIAEMQEVERQLLEVRDAESKRSTQRTLLTVAVGSLVSFALLAMVFIQLKSEITERKRAQEGLRRSEEQLQAILDTTTFVVFHKDLQGRFIFVNRPFERLFQRPKEQILGKTDFDLFPRSVAEKYRASDLSAMQSSHPVEIEEAVSQDDGTHTFLSVKFPLRDSAGEPYGVCGFSTDITERKRMEQNVARLNDELTRHSSQLEATNKELESFSYSVSHDLRAPLRSIDGFSLALLEDYSDALDDTGRDYLHRVRSATQRMGQLIDDMLTLSRVTRGEMCHESVDLSRIAESVAADLTLSAPNRQVEFAIDPDLKVHGDSRLLRVVIENLLGNAWKFTSKHPKARIEVGKLCDGDERVYFVRDDGAGFDSQYVEKLFGAFQRLHAMGDFAGTGVGLATVARIIRRHGGRVWAEGAVEQGATFYFTLPNGTDAKGDSV